MLYTFLHLDIKWRKDVSCLLQLLTMQGKIYPLSTGELPLNVFQKLIPGLNYT